MKLMLLHVLLSKRSEGFEGAVLGVLVASLPSRDLELHKTCVGVRSPAVLREGFALSRVEERCFGGVNRLFTLLMSRGVMLLVGVREPQGVLSSRGWWETQQGRVQGKKLGLTSGPGSAVP